MSPIEVGSCRASVTRFAFDADKGMCVPFFYGGCGGNDNNFDDEQKCRDKCGPVAEMLTMSLSGVDEDVDDNEGGVGSVVDKEQHRICHMPPDSGECASTVLTPLT